MEYTIETVKKKKKKNHKWKREDMKIVSLVSGVPGIAWSIQELNPSSLQLCGLVSTTESHNGPLSCLIL